MTGQMRHWDHVYTKGTKFSGGPSDFGLRAIEMMEAKGSVDVLELGCGQGRDTLEMMARSMSVTAMDYCSLACTQTAQEAHTRGLSGLKVIAHDVREGLPFDDDSFDVCFSHMFLTMELEDDEVGRIMSEVHRVLRSGGLHLFSVRNDHDDRFRQGIDHGSGMWEWNGFVVKYWTRDDMDRFSAGLIVEDVWEFYEGDPPKTLYGVMMRKP